jgi:hypothetical protein
MDKATAKSDGAIPKTQAKEGLAGNASGARELSNPVPESPSDVVLSDVATRAKYLTAMQHYYQYRTDGYAYRSRVFEWQLFSSRVIFIIVLVLVGAGIYFAAVQFRASMRHRADSSGGTQGGEQTQLSTQLEISAKGVVINSSVIGIIILTLSLAFFYLYLVYVYPIQNVI